jgi:hypothetical protein
MTGYLQRLIDTTPGILAATPQPVVRSQSPIAQSDQRLALDPAADAYGDVSADVSPAAFAEGPIAAVAQPAPRAMPPAAPMPQTAPPVAVQRFQAPSAAVTAPPPPPASVAPSAPSAPPGPAKAAVQSGSALQAPPPRQELTPQISPVTIINQLADTARPSPPETRADLRTQAPAAKSDEPGARPRPAPPLDSTKPTATEKAATRTPDELAYVSPAERVFEALQQLPRPAPSRETAEAIPPDRSPAAPTGRPAREIPAREIRETIREIVREVASTAPAPPRDTPRLPKTAAEASVIGPLGSPYAAARRLALMLR